MLLPSVGNAIDMLISVGAKLNEPQIQQTMSRAGAIMDKHFALGRYTTDFKQFQQSIDAATSRVTAFGLTAGIYFTIKSAIQGVVKATFEMEKGLTDINVILNLSSRNLKIFSEDLIRVASSTGQTFKTAAQAATEFSRQGLGVEETLKRTRDALILSRMAGIDTMSAVTDLTAAMNSFNNSILDSTQLVSKFVAVDQRFAVSSADLAEAIKRVGSTAQDAGLDIDQLIGLVTALQEKTARGGANIGQSFKTILTRVQDPGIIDQLESFGIVARDANRNLLPTIDILKRIAHELNSMQPGDAFKVENLIGKLYQINQLKAVMEDLNRKNSTADTAAGISRGSNNEALLRNEQLNQTLSAQFNRLAQNAKLSASKLGEGSLSPTLKTLFGYGNSFLEFANKTPEVEGIGTKIGQGILKGVGDALIVGGTTLVLILGKLAIAALSKVGQALGSFTFLQASLHKNLVQLQEQQNAALQSQAGAVNRITGANTARLGTEREILSTLEAQNAVQSRGQAQSFKVRPNFGIGNTSLATLPLAEQIAAADARISRFSPVIGPGSGGSAHYANIGNYYALGANMQKNDLLAQQAKIMGTPEFRQSALADEERARIARVNRMRFIAQQGMQARAVSPSYSANAYEPFLHYNPSLQGNIMAAFPQADPYNIAKAFPRGSMADFRGVSGSEMNRPGMMDIQNAARGGFFNRTGYRSATRMLQGMDPVMAANLNIERTAKIQTGLFGIGMAAPIAFDTIGELAFSGEGRRNRTLRAGTGALGLIGSGAAMGAAMGSTSGMLPGAIIGGALGGLLGIVNVFKEMNTVLPEVEAKLRGLTDTINRREEMFVDLNKGTEMAEGLTSGRISPSESNLKNFASMRSKLAARMSAAKIPLDQQLEMMGPKGMLSGDQSKLEGFRNILTPPALYSAQDLSGLTGLLGTTSATDKQGMEKLVSGFLSMKTDGGKTMLEEISSSSGQGRLGKVTFPTSQIINERFVRNEPGDFSPLSKLFESAGGDKDAVTRAMITLQKNPKTAQAFVEALRNVGIDASSGITKQGETFSGGLKPKTKGVNESLDLKRLALTGSLMGVNSDAIDLASFMQTHRKGEFSVFQAENQASISRAGMTQNPVQIATLQRKLAMQELERSGDLGLNDLNLGVGKSLLGGLNSLFTPFKTNKKFDTFAPGVSGLQGLAENVMFGKPDATKNFVAGIEAFTNSISNDEDLVMDLYLPLQNFKKEVLEHLTSVSALTNSNRDNKRALDITTKTAIEMAQVQSQATMSVNALNISMIQEAANFKAQRDSGLLGRQAVQSYTLGLDQERVRFGALKDKGFLFSDQIASGQLGIDTGDISTGAVGGKDMGSVMGRGFSNSLAFSVKDMYRDLAVGAKEVGDTLKASFKDAFLTFLDGSKNASDALRSLGLSFANKLLDIAAQGTTNLLFGGLQNLGSAAWAAYKAPSTGATGGYVTGGSGIRDDVPAMLNEGDFVVKQSSVNKYGVGFLNRLAGGGMPLSNFALSDENNPQNRIRMDQEAADLNAVISYQQALEAYNNAKKQRRLGALINLGIAGLGAGIGYAGKTWMSNIRANNAIATNSYYAAPSNTSSMSYNPSGWSHAAGGPIGRFAGGGSVDNIPALLTGGEYVVNRNAVSRLGVGFMHRLNRGEVPMYNTGGFVGEAISTNTGGNGESLNDSISRLINSNEKLRTSMEKGGGESKDGGAQNAQPIVGNISINISVDKNGEAKADVQTQKSETTNEDSANQGRRVGELVKAAVLETIIKETRNGGILEQNFQRRR